MKCMKCGTRIHAGQVFCDNCLTGMEQYPIPADTPVVLPPRSATPTAKRSAPHRRSRRPEDVIASLRAWVVMLAIFAVCLILALSMSVTMLVQLIENPQIPNSSAGQNYSTGPISSETGN